ncbi:hypothetical protein [Marinifilum sp. D714]|uniref:hypothetical protein n=1 Tax=Marinifilum sp. D714 TaxID=2937523 RepID=UPI0027CF3086|nr:hypothetical protein [Marinifilum sp. D714]MDQ2179561.1 hypothetical protein [Marinifilum sp. D714]
MKKLLYMASALALMFTACDPMEDTYDDLDNLQEPYTQEVEVEFTDADYATLSGIAEAAAKTDDEKDDAKDIAKYKSFSKYLPATKYVPMFLASEYSTLEEGSVATVTYDYYQGGLTYLYEYEDYVNDLENMESYTLTNADYDAMGDGPGQYNNFSSSHPAEDYLPDFLLGKYLDAEAGDEIAITYKYYDGSVSNITEFWAFDGSEWAKAEKEAPAIPEGVTLYELTTDDYDSMGEAYGQPGRYNNFDNNISPDDYLSTFLKVNFPYAVEGDKIAVQYKFYKGKIDGVNVTVQELKEFTFDGEMWHEYESTVKMSGQYMMTKDGWVFDPTVIFTMTSEDFQLIVDYSVATHGKTSKYPDSEYYYGASAKYINFDLRLKNRNTTDYPMPAFDGLSDEEAIALTYTRMAEGVEALLGIKYPDAVAQVSGIDVFYFVTFAAYEEGSIDREYTLKFQCTKSGPNPEFTYIEGLPE